jgi:hypothetical protein
MFPVYVSIAAWVALIWLVLPDLPNEADILVHSYMAVTMFLLYKFTDDQYLRYIMSRADKEGPEYAIMVAIGGGFIMVVAALLWLPILLLPKGLGIWFMASMCYESDWAYRGAR